MLASTCIHEPLWPLSRMVRSWKRATGSLDLDAMNRPQPVLTSASPQVDGPAATGQSRSPHPWARRYYRVGEVAAYFAVSRRTIYRLIEEGYLPAARIKNCVRIPAEALAAYEATLLEAEAR